jgi:diaminopimelate epimerase
MSIPFEKYQGTGNDFVLIDDREKRFPLQDLALVQRICDRRFGVGSDGLMLIRQSADHHFEMIFFNPDGSKSLCGNGSRCAVLFAERLGITDPSGVGTFITTDGVHQYRIAEPGRVAISMHDVFEMRNVLGHPFVHTGSPHLIATVPDVNSVEVLTQGAALRYHHYFAEGGGTNVNFVSQLSPNTWSVRTYERGVEGETLSCGTGVTAVAIAMGSHTDGLQTHELHTRGGILRVSYVKQGNHYSHIWLEGPAEHVFRGSIDA